jgi:hypothetical protein
MPNGNVENLNEDVEAIETKYGPFAEVYADSRAEAAHIAGNETGKKHWERVATTLKQDGEQ